MKLFGAKGWFYHQATEYDINGDGYLEIVSCRAKKPLFGGGSGDLVYLEPLDRSNITGTWKETVVGTGCDTYFILEDVTGDGVIDLVAAEFWGEKL